MALGGGKFTSMTKVLPGTYINVTAESVFNSELESGIVALPFCLNWGPDAQVIELSAADWAAKCWDILGYSPDAAVLLPIREIFTAGASKVILYNLNCGAKASGTYATAKYKGTRGNSIKIKVAANVDDNTKFDVTTIVDNMDQDVQTVAAANGLVDNAWVDFNKSATLAVTAATALSGGTNGTVTGTQHSAALAALEQKYFNVLICDVTDSSTQNLYTAYTARMRDSIGKDFQMVVYSKAADYEGTINVATTVSDAGAPASAMVYWTGGKSAACALGKSLTNTKYDGEYTPVCTETQAQLEAAIEAGKFIFHMVGDDVRILMDINSLVSFTAEKGSLMAKNEVIRVTDYLNNNIAVLFNTRYIGKVLNNETGRAHLRQDIAAIQDRLVAIGAVEYDGKDLTVSKGPDKGDVVIVDPITINTAMVRLYMTIAVN